MSNPITVETTRTSIKSGPKTGDVLTESTNNGLTMSNTRSNGNSKYSGKSIAELREIIARKHAINVNRFLNQVSEEKQQSKISNQYNRNGGNTNAIQKASKEEEKGEREKGTNKASTDGESTTNNVPIKKTVKCPLGISGLRMNCIKLLKGHRQRPSCVDWNPANGDLASVARDSLLLIWDPLTEHKKYAITLNNEFAMTVRYSPSGDFLATGGLDNTCSVWNVRKNSLRNGVQPRETYKPIAELSGHDGYIPRVEFVDDSQVVTCSGDSTIIYWDIVKQKQMSRLVEHQMDVCSISLFQSGMSGTETTSPGSTYHRNILLSGSADKRCKIWDTRDSKSVHTYCGNSDFNVVSWLPIAHNFVTGSDDGIVRLYDMRVHSVVNLFDPVNYPFSFQNYVSDEENKEETLKLEEKTLPSNSPPPEHNFSESEFTQRSTTTSAGNLHKNNAIRYEVKGLSVSKTGAFICVGYKNHKQCIVWNTLCGTQQSERLTHPDKFGSICLAHDGKKFATTCYDNDIRLWAPSVSK